MKNLMLTNFLKHKNWKLEILEVGGGFCMCDSLVLFCLILVVEGILENISFGLLK